jgi:hypothetical protein
MQEFSSISVSSYEAGSLAERLTAQSRDGWSVVAIVPTGSTITAYLSRESSGEAADSTADESVVAVSEPATDEPVADNTPAPTAESAPVETAPAESAPAEVAPAAAAATSWSALADQAAEAEAAATATTPDIEPSIPEVRLPESAPAAAVNPDPVSEPGGWAIAPESSGTGGTSSTSADPTIGLSGSGGADSIAAAANEVASTAAAEPAAAVTQQVQQTQAAAASAAPAGWYADPSSRYELRYWDGTQWTEHVSRGGQQFTDPPVA